MISQPDQQVANLAAALKSGDRMITSPSMIPSSENADDIALLKGALKRTFDALYVSQ